VTTCTRQGFPGPPFTQLRQRTEEVRGGQFGTWREEVVAQAAVNAADDALDDWVHELDVALKHLVAGDTESPRYRRYFSAAPSSLIRMGLETQLGRVRAWADSLSSEGRAQGPGRETAHAGRARRRRAGGPTQGRCPTQRPSRALHRVAHRRHQQRPTVPVRQPGPQSRRAAPAPQLARPLLPARQPRGQAGSTTSGAACSALAARSHAIHGAGREIGAVGVSVRLGDRAPEAARSRKLLARRRSGSAVSSRELWPAPSRVGPRFPVVKVGTVRRWRHRRPGMREVASPLPIPCESVITFHAGERR
jgi:hypothetical protein